MNGVVPSLLVAPTKTSMQLLGGIFKWPTHGLHFPLSHALQDQAQHPLCRFSCVNPRLCCRGCGPHNVGLATPPHSRRTRRDLRFHSRENHKTQIIDYLMMMKYRIKIKEFFNEIIAEKKLDVLVVV